MKHEDMSGQLQTIPARHGVATFVPRGRTIKVINTYGKQVVSTWAFGLGAPPEDGEVDENDVKEIEGQTERLKEEIGKQEKGITEYKASEEKENTEKDSQTMKLDAATEDGKEKANDKSPNPESVPFPSGSQSEAAEDPPEEAPDESKAPEKRTWSSYLPSKPTGYLPSLPYRSKGAVSQPSEPLSEKAKRDELTKKWSSYLPTGKSFSSYVPNVQLPDSSGVVSAFKASHYRDPNKSYAEQLYDFSKTPVGAGSIAVATGSGTASSIYAAYAAYTRAHPNSASSQPPMEYLSLPHTRAANNRLVPQVGDTLLTNLRNPILTLVEDTTPGAHDTLTAACDAAQYAALGVERAEEHGSCAENLVLALKELNEKVGLEGARAVGADVTVYIAPTPLHLFMNAPIVMEDNGKKEDGAGARGTKFKVEEPKGKKRGYVRFRAERDVVIVMSACPMDVGNQNGGRPMAANFMVEEAEKEDLSASTSSVKESKAFKGVSEKADTSGKKGEEKPKPMPRPRGGPAKAAAVMKSAEATKRRDSAVAVPEEEKAKKEVQTEPSIAEEEPKLKKKPRKLARRSPASTSTS